MRLFLLPYCTLKSFLAVPSSNLLVRDGSFFSIPRDTIESIVGFRVGKQLELPAKLFVLHVACRASFAGRPFQS